MYFIYQIKKSIEEITSINLIIIQILGYLWNRIRSIEWGKNSKVTHRERKDPTSLLSF